MGNKNILDAIFLICDTKLDAERKRGDFDNFKVTVHTPVKYILQLCDIIHMKKPNLPNSSFYIHADHNHALYEFVLDRELETKFNVSITSSNGRMHHTTVFEVDYDLIALYLERVNKNV